jgi:ribosomal protein S18 acetylase RimI-like enzyme
MDHSLTLRLAQYDDWKVSYIIKKRGLKNFVEKIWGWDENEQRQLHKVKFRPEKTQIIIFQKNEIGYLTTQVSDKEIYIENLILIPKFQNKGFGTKLMNEISNKADQEGKAVRLRVLGINKKAISFYNYLGFEIISESEHHYEMIKLATAIYKNNN